MQKSKNVFIGITFILWWTAQLWPQHKSLYFRYDWGLWLTFN